MSIALDTTSTASNAQGSPAPTWTHIVGSTATVLFAAITYGEFPASNPTTSCTWNGAAMTSLGRMSSNGAAEGFVELFYLLNPAAGSHSIVSTSSIYGGSQTILGASMSFSGVGSIGSPVTGYGASVSSFTAAIPSVSGHVAVIAAGTGSGFGAVTSPGVLAGSVNENTFTGAGNIGIAYQPSTSFSTSITWAITNDDYGWVGVDLLPPSTPIANTFEGGTNNTGITAANSGGTSGTAIASTAANAGTTLQFSTDFAHRGTLALRVSFAAASAGYAIWNFVPSTIGARTVIACYVYTPSVANIINTDILVIRSASTNVAGLSFSSTGHLVLRAGSSATVVWTAAAALPKDQWFQVLIAVTIGTTTSNGIIECTYSLLDSPFVTDGSGVLTGQNLGIVAMGTIRLGYSGNVGTPARNVYYDDFQCQELPSGYIGPTKSKRMLVGAGSPAPSAFKVGSSDVSAVYQGSTLVWEK